MKTALLYFLLAAVIGGCSPFTVQLRAPCAGRTRAGVFGTLTTLLVAEGFSIESSNEATGLLQASKGVGSVTEDHTSLQRWSFIVAADTVLAYPRILQVTKGGAIIESAGPEVADDDLPQWSTWYWTVRNGLERHCGAPIVFVTRERPFW